MSRTYRQHNKTKWWASFHTVEGYVDHYVAKRREIMSNGSSYMVHYYRQWETEEEFIRFKTSEWKSFAYDGKMSETGIKGCCKHFAKRKVRSRTRYEYSKFKEDPEYINRPHERDTRGEIWNWD